MLWLLFLPIQLAFALLFGLLSLPFLLLRGLLKLLGAIIVLPIILILAAIGLVIGGLVFFVPFIVLAVVVWGLVRWFCGRPLRAAI
jgi:hypothetical protein